LFYEWDTFDKHRKPVFCMSDPFNELLFFDLMMEMINQGYMRKLATHQPP